MAPPNPARAAAPLVSVVMPAHNEEELLGHTIDVVTTALAARSVTFELLVIENGSTDGTLPVAVAAASTRPEVHVVARPGADYGAAMRAGILDAGGEVVVVFDVDYYDPEFVDRVLPELTRPGGPAIVVGSKRAPGTRDTRPWPRRAITAGFATVLAVGFRLRVSDTHGMKAMRRAQVEPIARRCRFGTDLFDTELVLRADRAGLKIAEVPVTVEELRPSRSPIARRIVRTAFGLVRLRVVLWRDARHARGPAA
jgi:glycosyltransferase involved in cell wall biosynthesis